LQTFFAPAKLNLFLHIVGQRADGYHLLQSVFQLIDYGDTIRLGVRADGEIRHLNPLAGVPVEQDLMIRAARLLQQETGSRLGIDLHIEKRLPMGGGLGGGSSDAATVLLALNQLWQLDLPRSRLQQLGLSLGADVPFFIFGQNAWVEGVGEKLTPITLMPSYYVVLIPKVKVATATIFCDEGLTKNTKSIRIRDFETAEIKNDLEAVACKQYPEIGEYLQWLSQYSLSRMTGSGGCVFTSFPTQKQADEVLSHAPVSMTGFVAQGINQHPLFGFARC
jgi:4-diphosphocytidyl-2-C-methyl-D-erythritol kinase